MNSTDKSYPLHLPRIIDSWASKRSYHEDIYDEFSEIKEIETILDETPKI